MSAPAVRSLVAQGVLGLTVCLGGYAAAVLPLREKLDTARAELARAEAGSQEARGFEASIASTIDRLAEADRQAAAIVSGGAMARSQEALYAAVSARAADLGMRIDEFTPVEPVRGSAGGERAATNPGDVVLRCKFAATGSFGELAQLLRALGDECGYASVRSVRLTPTSDASLQTVHAEVETEHYAVDPTRAAPGGGEGHP